jgi:Family of unknown function (DUF6049)
VADAAHFRGTGHRTARRWLRRTASVLATAPLLTGMLAGATATSAHAATPASVPARAPAALPAKATKGNTVGVTLNQLTPSAPTKGDTLTISGTVTNRSEHPVKDAEVDLRVGPRLAGRSAIDDAASNSEDTEVEVAALGGKYEVKFPELASNVATDFSLSVPVGKLGLDGDGVYQLGVSVSGETQDVPYEQVLGIQQTFLPWQPDATDKKTQLAFMWPLISTVHLSAQTGPDEQQTPIFDDDSLAADLKPGGRLQQMVSLGSQLPVTWVIDPDLLATVDAMTHKYQVRSGNTTVPGKNQQVANQWMESLQRAVQGHTVIALPFADPDIAALADHGSKVSGSISHLQTATELARTTVDTILHITPSTDFAWPVDGAVDRTIVNVATSAGADTIIARSDSLKDDLPYTPTSARPIGGGTTAVVADAGLSTAFQGPLTTTGSSTLAVQKFLAQTLALSRQLPSQQRSIVVAPQRMPTAAQARAMASALHGLDTQRWTEPQDLVAAAAATPDNNANTRLPRAGAYPSALKRQELMEPAFQEIQDIQSRLTTFTDILSSPDRVEAPFANAMNRSMSTSWRGRDTEAAQYRNSVDAYLSDLAGQVSLVQKTTLTLSGRSATIPVTVQNRLFQSVQHLVLRLTSTQPTRLQVDGNHGTVEQPVDVGGGHTQSVQFTGTGNANGPVEMKARLYTADGQPYGKTMTFEVKVSEITPTVMLVIAGGVLLLVLAGVRMYSQRKRAAARRASAAARGTQGPGDGEGGTSVGDPGRGPDGQQPSDPDPDTGPENTAPSGTGEKVDR